MRKHNLAKTEFVKLWQKWKLSKKEFLAKMDFDENGIWQKRKLVKEWTCGQFNLGENTPWRIFSTKSVSAKFHHDQCQVHQNYAANNWSWKRNEKQHELSVFISSNRIINRFIECSVKIIINRKFSNWSITLINYQMMILIYYIYILYYQFMIGKYD